ncbi:MAG: glycosyltransferase family 9 protein [Bacteroidetes bacterium]|nr:glycosyltransferase family 9 protein [Bacteroidota bacterium]
MSEIKKILVVRLSSLGDIILSFPLLNILKKKFPKSEIHFLTGKKFHEIVRLNKNADKVIELNDEIRITRNEIGKNNYDLILDIHKNFRSIYLTAFNGREVRRYQKGNLKKFLLVKFRISLFDEIIPVYKKYLLTLKDILNEEETEFTAGGLQPDGNDKFNFKYTVIAPSSRHFTKTYPAEKFTEFILSRPDEVFILTGSSEETDMKICGSIAVKCKNTFNLCGKLSLKELAEVVNGSEYVISNDSAVLHLSEALKKKTIGIFGSTVREFGFFPQLSSSEVLEVKGLKCRPCSHIGRPECPEGHFRCMMETDLKELRYRPENNN